MLPILRNRNDRINPVDDFYDVFDNISRWTDNFLHFNGLPTVRGVDQPGFIPSLDVVEKNKEYVLDLEIPGVDKEYIDVSLGEDRVLVIKGSKTSEEHSKDTEPHVNERYFGSFRREIRLPQNVDTDKIDLQFKNGVLTVTLPKITEKQPEIKKLKIK